MNDIVETIKLGRPTIGADQEEWIEYNSLLCSLIGQTDDVDTKKAAINEFIEVNQNLIGKYVNQLSFRIYEGCEFEDAYHVLIICVAQVLAADDFNGEFEAMIFRKAVFEAKHELHTEYKDGGIGISYSQHRKNIREGKPTVDVEVMDVDPDWAGNIDVEEVIETHDLGDFLSSVIDIAEEKKMINGRDKAIIYAHFCDNRSFKDIAEEYNVLENSIAHRTRRVLSKLKNIAIDLDPKAMEYAA